MDSHAGVFLAIFIASLVIISGLFDDKPKPENYIREFKAINNHGNIGVCFQIDDKKVVCNFD
jgi:hypothetical protein